MKFVRADTYGDIEFLIFDGPKGRVSVLVDMTDELWDRMHSEECFKVTK